MEKKAEAGKVVRKLWGEKCSAELRFRRAGKEKKADRNARIEKFIAGAPDAAAACGMTTRRRECYQMPRLAVLMPMNGGRCGPKSPEPIIEPVSRRGH
jgi:hypothetical protein